MYTFFRVTYKYSKYSDITHDHRGFDVFGNDVLEELKNYLASVLCDSPKPTFVTFNNPIETFLTIYERHMYRIWVCHSGVQKVAILIRLREIYNVIFRRAHKKILEGLWFMPMDLIDYCITPFVSDVFVSWDERGWKGVTRLGKRVLNPRYEAY